MIYFISIIDVTMGGGTPKWDFIHPETPKHLMKRLVKYRDHAAGFIYAIIEAFGGEILGDQLRELRLSDIQVIFSTLKHKDLLFYVIFIADIRDNPQAVNRIFREFYEKYYEDFDILLTSEIISPELIERLRTAMAQFLVPYFRQNKYLGARDILHLASSYVATLIFTLVMIGIAWVINSAYGLMEKHPVTFALLVLFLVFVLPAIPIGWLTQYRRFAIIVAYATSLSVVVGAVFLWRDLLITYARVITSEFSPDVLLSIGAVVGGIMLGTFLAIASYTIAAYFEKRSLTSVRELKHIKPIEESPELVSVGQTPSSEEEINESYSVPSMDNLAAETKDKTDTDMDMTSNKQKPQE